MKTFVALSACVLFTFCSSSKKTIPPTGVSNVKVGSGANGDTMTSAATASAKYSSADRDWAYRSSNPTDLQGTWTLDGMATSAGTWSATTEWYKDTTATTTMDTAMVVTADGSQTGGTGGKKSGYGRKRGKGSARKALYDSANARLKREFRTNYTIDTTVQPYKYWQRIPTIILDPANLVFTGNTGCNSISGSFRFGTGDLQFSRTISTSKMACNEYDESAFLSDLKKVDSYTLNGNTLELRQGNTLLLTFKKS